MIYASRQHLFWNQTCPIRVLGYERKLAKLAVLRGAISKGEVCRDALYRRARRAVSGGAVFQPAHFVAALHNAVGHNRSILRYLGKVAPLAPGGEARHHWDHGCRAKPFVRRTIARFPLAVELCNTGTERAWGLHATLTSL